MLEATAVIGGAVIVAVVFLEAFMTTLAVAAGAGPLTSRVLGLCWRALLSVHRQDSRSSILNAAGMVLLTGTVALWVLALWVGWTLIFLGSGSVVDAQSREPARLADVIYFAGFTIFTLGTGDYVAAEPAWRVVESAASFSGLFLVTLAITYLISVVSAAVTRRSLAMQIRALGRSATEIVTGGWDEHRFTDMFQEQLVSLTPQVAVSAEQHLAYPVLHFFHARSPELSAPLALASLDDALALMEGAVAPGHRPQRSAVQPLRATIERYLSTATGTSWSPDVAAPPPPSADGLAEAGIPVVPAGRFRTSVHQQAERRTDMHRLVAGDGWSWPRT